MRKRKRNGAGVYKGKHYWIEKELDKRYKQILELMDVANRRIIHDAPCKGTIDIKVIRNAVRETIKKRRQGNG